MRVLMLSLRYDPYFSGPLHQAKRINEIIHEKYNTQFTILTMFSKLSNKSTENVIFIPSFRLKNINSKTNVLLWTLFSCIYIIKNKKKIDVIHSLDLYFPSLIFSIISKFIRKPFIAKSSIDSVYSKKGLAGKIKRAIFRKNTNIVSISMNTRNELSDFKHPASKIFYIPNGVDTKVFSPLNDEDKKLLRKKYKVDQYDFIALYTGGITPRKSVLDLLKVWKEIILNNKNAVLILAGPQGHKEYLNKVIDFIEEYELIENVIMLDYLKEIRELYKLADIFLFASKKEGLPNSILEAMSSGIPVVSRDIPGCNDLIKNGINGYLIENSDFINEFRQAILKFFHSKELRNTISINNRKFIENYFSINNVADLYYQTYNFISNK
jgi:glycosyltransferase involved in cell wall biosynthesis